jgi:hypothetical protein
VIGAITAGLFGTGVPPVTSSYESIATASGNGSSATLSFTSIPSGFKHLQIRGIGRDTSGSSGNNPATITFNSDTGANYDSHLLYGLGSSAGGAASTSRNNLYWIGEFVGTADLFGAIVIDILDYTDTNKNKTVRSFGAFDSNGGGRIDYTSGLWRNTSAITRIDITVGASNWANNTQFALYGIKG